MDVINILTIFVFYFILCEHVIALQKYVEEESHEESVHHDIDNNENTLRKSDTRTEKSKNETPPLKYIKNEYKYEPNKIQDSKNMTNGKTENESNILLKITRVPHESPKVVKKKTKQHSCATLGPPVAHHDELDGLAGQRTHQSQKPLSNSHNPEQKSTNHSNCSDYSKTRKSIDRHQEDICNDEKSNKNIKSNSADKDTQDVKIEPRASSANGIKNKKKVKMLFFEENDPDNDRTEIINEHGRSTPVLIVYKKDSSRKSSSPASDDYENSTSSPKAKSANVELVQKGELPDNFANSVKETNLPAILSNENLKSAISTECARDNNDISTDSIILKTNGVGDYPADNIVNRPLKEYGQEESNVINLVRTTLADTMGPTDDIVVKTSNINEVIQTFTNPDEGNYLNSPGAVENDNLDTESFNYYFNYMRIPKSFPNTQYRYTETAQYLPNYGYNDYSRNLYDKYSIPQQNYYYKNFVQPSQYLYNPYRMYPQECRGQNYYPKATIVDYAYPYSNGYYNNNYNQYKPDYTYVTPSFKYPIENLLQHAVKPTNYNLANWNTGNFQKQPGINSYYPPIVYDYNKGEYPKEYIDKIWRTWQNTEIQIKRPKNDAITNKPCDGDKCGFDNFNRRKANKKPSTYFNNQRKRISNANGYYN